MARLSSLTSTAVIERLKNWFFLFGFPRTIRTDGSPQFRTEFREFCEASGIVHEVTSPYNPASNGGAESGVKIVKTLMKKTKPSAYNKALSLLRNTCSSNGSTPSSLFFSRVVRTATPVLDNTQPLTQPSSISQSRNLDRLRPLPVGTRVGLQNPLTGLWQHLGTITSTSAIGRSYNIKLADGSTLWRNRRFLRRAYV